MKIQQQPTCIMFMCVCNEAAPWKLRWQCVHWCILKFAESRILWNETSQHYKSSIFSGKPQEHNKDTEHRVALSFELEMSIGSAICSPPLSLWRGDAIAHDWSPNRWYVERTRVHKIASHGLDSGAGLPKCWLTPLPTLYSHPSNL